MTSRISREVVEDAAWKAGVRDVKKMNELLRVIDLYAYALARIPEPEMLPVPGDTTRQGASLYLCKNCGTRLPLGMFPADRQADPRHPYDCIPCGGTDRRTYKCPECERELPLSDYPEAKQLRPRLHALCTWCEPRTITQKDLGKR